MIDLEEHADEGETRKWCDSSSKHPPYNENAVSDSIEKIASIISILFGSIIVWHRDGGYGGMEYKLPLDGKHARFLSLPPGMTSSRLSLTVCRH
jgi:hypothetical protein